MRTFRKLRIPETDYLITLKDDDGYLWLEIESAYQVDKPGGHGIVILPPESVKELIEAPEYFDAGIAGAKLEQRIKARCDVIDISSACLADWWVNNG